MNATRELLTAAAGKFVLRRGAKPVKNRVRLERRWNNNNTQWTSRGLDVHLSRSVQCHLLVHRGKVVAQWKTPHLSTHLACALLNVSKANVFLAKKWSRAVSALINTSAVPIRIAIPLEPWSIVAKVFVILPGALHARKMWKTAHILFNEIMKQKGWDIHHVNKDE